MFDALATLVTISGLLVLSQLSPGPDVFFVFRTALAQGWKAGAAVGAGVSLGFLVQAAVVAACGTWVMQQPWSPYVAYAAAAWLLYLAWKIFPRRCGVEVELAGGQGARRERLRVLVWQGFLNNALNLKCSLFICGLSLKPLDDYGSRFAWFAPALVLALTLSGFLGWVLWSVLLQWKPLRNSYQRHTAGIDALFSALLIVFALLLFFS